MRPLDHLVMPVADLAAARDRLTRLGFTVAAEGRHPFGTQNACVYFADATFIEPLAVADRSAYDAAVQAGNRFVIGDRMFRAIHGQEGLSALAFATDDAGGDHVRFAAAGYAAGDQLAFARPVVFPDGRAQQARFRLAFAETGRSGDVFAFTCQRIDVPVADRTALQTHANGVVGIRAVVLAAEAPEEAGAFLRTVSASVPHPVAADGGSAAAADRVAILTPRALIDTYGVDPCGGGGLTGGVVVFAVTSIDELRAGLTRTAIDHVLNGALLLVPPAPGQGATFAFMEVDP